MKNKRIEQPDYLSPEATNIFVPEEFPDCIILDTFPDSDNDYQKKFIVNKAWLVDILERMDALNDRKGVQIERFLNNFIWDETEAIYDLAKQQGKIVKEWHE